MAEDRSKERKVLGLSPGVLPLAPFVSTTVAPCLRWAPAIEQRREELSAGVTCYPRVIL